MNDPVWQRIYCPAIHGKARLFVEKEEDGKQVWDCESFYQQENNVGSGCRRRWFPDMLECLVGKKVKVKP